MPKAGCKMSAPKGCKNFWVFIQGNSLVFLLNNTLVYMFPNIQNKKMKKDCIWVRMRGAILAKKGTPKLNLLLPVHCSYIQDAGAGAGTGAVFSKHQAYSFILLLEFQDTCV